MTEHPAPDDPAEAAAPPAVLVVGDEPRIPRAPVYDDEVGQERAEVDEDSDRKNLHDEIRLTETRQPVGRRQRDCHAEEQSEEPRQRQ